MRKAAVLGVMLLFFVTGSNAGEPGHPFADFVNWEKQSSRQKYEKSLEKAGITIRKTQMAPWLTAEPLAERQECLFLEKGGVIVGYGILFENFFKPASVQSKTTGDLRDITLHRVEALYDLSGRHIFLVSYRFRISDTDVFIAEWLLDKEPRAKRKIFYIDRPLNEEYELTESSLYLAKLLLAMPRKCFTPSGY